MSAPYERLFQPLDVAGVSIPNRIVNTAHWTMYDNSGEPGERQGAYLAARARGGAGLIITDGALSVGYRGGIGHVNYGLADESGGMVSDGVLSGFHRRNAVVTSMVHEAGARIFCQLKHGNGRMQLAGNIPTPGFVGVSASQTADFHSGFMAHELEHHELAELAALSGRAAALIRECDYDGLEFRAHGGYLFQQFLSPMCNLRTDEYGGTTEKRMRFVIECIQACRDAVGPDYALGVRLAVDDGVPGGLALDEGVEIARLLAATGLIDYISANIGITTVDYVLPDYSHAHGFLRGVAGAVKRAVPDIPVMVAGRITTPELAEDILASGEADLIGMARAMIADPDWGRKAREGRASEIRPCVGGNDACSFHAMWGIPISCVHNPMAGREHTMPELVPADVAKRVVVVGGGVAGMKAAEVAARRGHAVTLYEREDTLGGQVTLQGRVVSRREYLGIVRSLERELSELDVEIALGTEPSAADLLAAAPDAIVLAIGSTAVRTGFTNLTPDLPGLPGAELPHVMTEIDLLRGAAFGPRVVIVEDSSGADYKVSLAAEFLADGGAHVTVLTTDVTVGDAIPYVNSHSMYRRLEERGVVIRPHTGVKRIDPDGLTTFHVFTRAEERIEAVDTVVLVLGHRTDRTLHEALRGQVAELHEVGDALAPRTVRDAIADGFVVACAL